MNEEACYSVDTVSWRHRIRERLFPSAPRPRKEDDKRTFVTTMIHVSVDWTDRLRLLWLGRMKIQVVTYTDVEVKDAESVSVFSVE